MKKLFILVLLGLCGPGIQAQIDTSSMIKVKLKPDNPKDPIVLVYHRMGDVRVQGTESNDVFVYAQEMLPSAELFLNQEKRIDFFSFVNENTGSMRQVSRNEAVKIIEEDNLVQIQTSPFSFNTNVFVLVPHPSSVAVNVESMGSIEVNNVKGNVEANTSFGNIRVANVEGSVLANTNTGKVIGDFGEVNITKPVILTAFIGNVEIIVPRTSNTTLSLYSELGSIFSNYDVQALNALNTAATDQRGNGKFSISLNTGKSNFIAKTIQGDIYLRHGQQ